MLIRNGGFSSAQLREIALSKILAVVVERKSVVPFVTFTILAGVATILARYNVLWFLIDLTTDQIRVITSAGVAATVSCAIPMVLRLLFVNVLVRPEGEPKALKVRLVAVRPAKRLAKRFRELSTTS
jgi:hypothetical protein